MRYRKSVLGAGPDRCPDRLVAEEEEEVRILLDETAPGHWEVSLVPGPGDSLEPPSEGQIGLILLGMATNLLKGAVNAQPAPEPEGPRLALPPARPPLHLPPRLGSPLSNLGGG